MLTLRPATPLDIAFLRNLHHVAYRGVVLRQFGAWEEDAQDFLGIGTFALGAELDRARASGKPVELRVLKENHARRLYERHGFRVTGETETHYLMRRTWPREPGA